MNEISFLSVVHSFLKQASDRFADTIGYPIEIDDLDVFKETYSDRYQTTPQEVEAEIIKDLFQIYLSNILRLVKRLDLLLSKRNGIVIKIPSSSQREDDTETDVVASLRHNAITITERLDQAIVNSEIPTSWKNSANSATGIVDSLFTCCNNLKGEIADLAQKLQSHQTYLLQKELTDASVKAADAADKSLSQAGQSLRYVAVGAIAAFLSSAFGAISFWFNLENVPKKHLEMHQNSTAKLEYLEHEAVYLRDSDTVQDKSIKELKFQSGENRGSILTHVSSKHHEHDEGQSSGLKLEDVLGIIELKLESHDSSNHSPEELEAEIERLLLVHVSELEGHHNALDNREGSSSVDMKFFAGGSTSVFFDNSITITLSKIENSQVYIQDTNLDGIGGVIPPKNN